MKYKTVEDAKNVISRNGHIVSDKKIKVFRPGIKVLGAVDYLVNHCGYELVR